MKIKLKPIEDWLYKYDTCSRSIILSFVDTTRILDVSGFDDGYCRFRNDSWSWYISKDYVERVYADDSLII